jgi:hypothetical protein
MASLRRLIVPLLAVALLAWVVHWLVSRPVVRFRLGEGEELVGLPGADGFAVREAEGLWRLYDAAARSQEDGALLPAGVVGEPLVAPDGGAWVLTDAGLLRAPHVHAAGAARLVLPAAALPHEARLAGLPGGKQPALTASAGDGRELLLLLDAEGAGGANPHLQPLRDTRGSATLPAGAAADDLVDAPGGAALALRTAAGWEAWSWDAAGAGRRVLAEGCTGPGAVFTPDAQFLIVPGRVDGLWELSLADGRLSPMAEGNFGVSRRVGSSHSFRGEGEHMRLVAPQWNMDHWLNIQQTHLFGGGHWAVSLAFMHHYGLALSRDGRFMAYCQARFEESGEDPIDEELWVLDFDEAVDTVYVGSRHGGRARQGPCFVGSGASLVYLADGDVQRIEMLPGSGKED